MDKVELDTPREAAQPPPELLKMSLFARRAGVPIPTIKHYLREGLLPEPTRTSPNMAYYDAALVPRVQAIKRLQRELFLPLKVIRQVLDRLDDGVLPPQLAVEATVTRVLGDLAPRESQSREQVLDSGFTQDKLQMFADLGIMSPQVEGDREMFRGDDLALLRLFGQARRAGLTEQMLPPSILRAYIDALEHLVEAELKLFDSGVLTAAGEDLTKLTEVATTLSERLVVLLRRKVLLRLLRRPRAKPAQPEA